MKKNMDHIKEKDNAVFQKKLYDILQKTEDEDTRWHLQYDKDFNNFDAIEKEIAQNPQLEKLADLKNCNSFDDRIESICNVPQKTSNYKSHKKTKGLTRFTSIAASFILLLSIGLILRFWIFAPATNGNQNYNYSDSELTIQISTEEEIKDALQNFYSPQLSILENVEYNIAKHNKSHEIVYVVVSGVYTGENHVREVSLSIYLHEKYVVKNESNFHSDNTILVGDKTVSIKKIDNKSSIYYYAGFNILSVRYYIEFSAMIENDFNNFLNIFLAD